MTGKRRKGRLGGGESGTDVGVTCVDSTTGKGWVVAKLVAGEVKRTGESRTMMGAVMAG